MKIPPSNLLSLLAGLLGCVGALRATDALDTWHWRLPGPPGNEFNAIAFGNRLYVAVRDYAAILPSTNSTGWESHGLETSKRLDAVAFGNGQFVAIGRTFPELPGGVILVSSNGLDWTDESPAGTQVLTSIAFGGGQFIAAGSKWSVAGGVLFISTNGANWIDQSAAVPDSIDSLTWGNGRFVALGGDDFYSSTNGLVWQTTVAPVRGLAKVAFLHGQFVAVGYDDDYLDTGIALPTFSFSTNGQDWTAGRLLDPSLYNPYDPVEVNG